MATSDLDKLLTDPHMDWKQFVPEAKTPLGDLVLYFRRLLPTEWPDDAKMADLARFRGLRIGVALQYELYYGRLKEYRDKGALLRAYEECRQRVRLPEVEKEWRAAFEQPSETGNRLLDRLRQRLLPNL